jgi:predicted Holliday junction resolvase-like endonuclease
MDIFLALLFTGILGFIVYYNVYDHKPSKKAKKQEIKEGYETPTQQENPLSKEIDKLIEKEKEKDIIHSTSVNTLTQEITKLKEKQSELLLTNKNWQTSYNQLNAEQLSKIGSLENKISEVSAEKQKVTSQKKSSEVRLGHIAETLAPFLDQFEFDPETCTFMGRPIDYISFGDDKITFIEIKSGNSQLSSKQRLIRDLVKNKHVAWKEVRIK